MAHMRARFSFTLRAGATAVSWGETPIISFTFSDEVTTFSPNMKASPLVDELDDRRPLVEALDSSIARISLFFGILILLLLSISFVLINNMVRLSVFARRFTIHTMKLVGATRAFIRKPFLKAALVQGLVSALVASLIMFGLLLALKGSFPELYASVGGAALLLSVGAVVLCGVLICVLSTFVVVDKLVAADKDDLYY